MFIVLVFLTLLPIILSLLYPLRKIGNKTLRCNRQVVICVAARNEEINLATCLDSLLGLNYPKSAYVIYVADDGSTDNTAEILRDYAVRYSQIKILQVDRNDQRTKGKARALAQLTDSITSDFIAFTDADVMVTKDWLVNMVSAIGDKGMISGTTFINGVTNFGCLQSMDWFYGQLQVQLSSRFLKGSPTAMGNNMLVSTEAYQSIGGYGDMPFSVTEDTSLQQVFEKHGYNTQMLLAREYLVFTQPEYSWADLLSQRQRWGNAIYSLPKILVFFLVIQQLFLPLVFFSVFFSWWLPLCLLLLKSLLNVAVLQMKNPMESNWSVGQMLLFEVYQLFLSVGLLAKILFSRKIKWKNQTM
jgi:cellulose synthase/poly-beta-1,6-N-acetylglucosamine synthase-like glycosyltransferase